jgi:hypothetical protein
VAFEATTPGSKVRRLLRGPNPDDLPEKQKTAFRRPSQCMHCNV